MTAIPCTERQAMDILQDASVLPLLAFKPVGIKEVEKWLLGNALLIVIPKNETAEVHIACRYRDRAGLRDSLLQGIAWLTDERGFNRLLTTVSDERKALIKLLKNLGFVKKQDGWIWELKPR